MNALQAYLQSQKPPLTNPQYAAILRGWLVVHAPHFARKLTGESVRRYQLPRSHDDHRVPHPDVQRAIAATSGGAVTPNDLLEIGGGDAAADGAHRNASASSVPIQGLEPARRDAGETPKAGRLSRAPVDGDGLCGLPTRSAIAVKPIGKKRAPIAMAIKIARARKGAATRARMKRSRA